jgi:hypothetical protein
LENIMNKDQTVEIEKAVRRVLGDVLSEASDDLNQNPPNNNGGAGGGFSRSLSASADPGGDDDSAEIPQAVMSAVTKLCEELSPEQATALASLFEAIGSQGEEDEPEEEDDDQESLTATGGEMELSSEMDAKAEGQRIAAGGIRIIIRLLKKNGPKIYRAAVKAAKQGRAAFNRWVNGLSGLNPLKWAIKGLPSIVATELISWLASQFSVKPQKVA